jgi:hypothetical protein
LFGKVSSTDYKLQYDMGLPSPDCISASGLKLSMPCVPPVHYYGSPLGFRG